MKLRPYDLKISANSREQATTGLTMAEDASAGGAAASRVADVDARLHQSSTQYKAVGTRYQSRLK